MRRSLAIERVRRLLGEQGFATATVMPPAVEGRPDDFRLSRSRVLSDGPLRAHPVGPPAPCPESLAFLDGVQRYETVSFAGLIPIVVAELAAGVRLRRGQDARTEERAARRLILSTEEVLASIEGTVPDADSVPIQDAGMELLHPLKLLELARKTIDRERTRLEHTVGRRFRARHPEPWIVVDGVLSDNEEWALDQRAIGVSKSHATLPFDSDDLLVYLRLGAGERSSVFEPERWRFNPVHSFGLRLWPWEGQDLLHGLVRIEICRGADSDVRADQISRWLLAERTPLSRPDPRWDRLLYGVAGVERALGR